MGHLPPFKAREVKFLKCQGFGHYANQCPNKRNITFHNRDMVESACEDEEEGIVGEEERHEDEFNPNEGDCEQMYMITKVLSTQASEEEDLQRENLFHSRCLIQGHLCSVIVDSGSCVNVASIYLVEKMKLPCIDHPKPYKLQWLNDSGEVKVGKQVRMSFAMGKSSDVVPVQATHLLLGRPWKYDRKVIYDGHKDKHSLEFE